MSISSCFDWLVGCSSGRKGEPSGEITGTDPLVHLKQAELQVTQLAPSYALAFKQTDANSQQLTITHRMINATQSTSGDLTPQSVIITPYSELTDHGQDRQAQDWLF